MYSQTELVLDEVKAWQLKVLSERHLNLSLTFLRMPEPKHAVKQRRKTNRERKVLEMNIDELSYPSVHTTV